nr:GIY-YIG endonuclease [Gongronella sp. w5]
MKTILIIKLLITLSIIDYLSNHSNIKYNKLDIKLIKRLIKNPLKILFPTYKISELLYLVELILSESTESNFNLLNNKLPTQNSLDYVNKISLNFKIKENELNKLISSNNLEKSDKFILECLKRFNNNNMDNTDFPISIYFDSILDRPLILNQLKNKSGIYCWYCKPTGNMYVGSAVNLRTRTNDYYQESYIKDREHLPIIRAMEKYGRNNFSLIILEYTNKINLIRSEQYWIDFITPSYNILTIAGNWSNHQHSEDSKLKISKSRIGKFHTEEVKKLMSSTRQKENNPFYNKTHTQETKDLMKAYQSSRNNDPNPGFLIDLYSSENNLLMSFKSIREITKFFKADTRTIKRYLESNELFRGEYFIKYVNN